MTFVTQSMQEILPVFQKELELHDSVSFSVLNPDRGEGYAGNLMLIDGIKYMYRSLKAWNDLAELLQCKMLLPKSEPKRKKIRKGRSSIRS